MWELRAQSRSKPEEVREAIHTLRSRGLVAEPVAEVIEISLEEELQTPPRTLTKSTWWSRNYVANSVAHLMPRLRVWQHSSRQFRQRPYVHEEYPRERRVSNVVSCPGRAESSERNRSVGEWWKGSRLRVQRKTPGQSIGLQPYLKLALALHRPGKQYKRLITVQVGAKNMLSSSLDARRNHSRKGGSVTTIILRRFAYTMLHIKNIW